MGTEAKAKAHKVAQLKRGGESASISREIDIPKKRKGATDYRQYARALGILDGSAIGDRAEAVALIHATPKSKRSEFQKDIWEFRKERYGPSGRKDGGAGGDSVPF